MEHSVSIRQTYIFTVKTPKYPYESKNHIEIIMLV